MDNQSITKFEVNYNYKQISELDDVFKSVGDCVYVIEFNEVKAVKIGFSTNFYERIDSFKTCAPFGIGRVFCKEVVNPRIVESELHKYFDDCRLNGEWFSCDFECAVEILNSGIQSELFCDTKNASLDVNDNPIINYLRVSNFINRIDLTRQMTSRDCELDYKAEILLSTAYWYKKGKYDDWIDQWFKYVDSLGKFLDVILSHGVGLNDCENIVFEIHRILFGVVARKRFCDITSEDDLWFLVDMEVYDVTDIALINTAQVLSKDKIVKDNALGDMNCSRVCFDVATRVAALRS